MPRPAPSLPSVPGGRGGAGGTWGRRAEALRHGGEGRAARVRHGSAVSRGRSPPLRGPAGGGCCGRWGALGSPEAGREGAEVSGPGAGARFPRSSEP